MRSAFLLALQVQVASTQPFFIGMFSAPSFSANDDGDRSW